MACPIGNTGWSFQLEMFYNPDAVRRFGLGTFGSENFGDYTGASGSVARWVDLTGRVSGISFTRGLTAPNVNSATDSLEFSLLDNTETSLVGWLPPKSLASPNIHTPIMLSLIAPDDTKSVLLTCRIDTIAELHGGATREVLFRAYGTKTSLRTLVLPQIFPQATAQVRIENVLTQIGYTDPVQPFPPQFQTVLLRDPQDRTTEAELDAYGIIQQAALSCGHMVVTASDGTLAWSDLSPAPDPVPVTTFTDCAGDDGSPGTFEVDLTNAGGEGNELVNASGQILITYDHYPVTTRQLWQSDTEEVLNVVQVLSVNPAFSAEAIDVPSVERWGRQNSGFGFPILTANKDKADAQLIADEILVSTANRVNRVSEVEFHTMVDSRWLDVLAYLEIDANYLVQRTEPTLGEMPFTVIGYTVAVTSTHIEGVLHGITTYQTL